MCYDICNCFSDTFDVVRQSSNKIQIIDFGPFDPKRTMPLLFTWEDLRAKERNLNVEPPAVEFRILGEDPGILPYPHTHYGIPQDFIIDCCGDGNDSSVTECGLAASSNVSE